MKVSESRIQKYLWWFIIGAVLLCIVLIGYNTATAAPRDGRRTTATYYSGSFGACGKPLNGNYAASKFYACGSKVLVKHGGKQVTVTILDRCQCMMDMSKSSFKKLAPLSVGVINVRLYKKG